MTADDALRELHAAGSPEGAAVAQRYFRTGPGGYAERDRFLGIRAPVLRAMAKRFRDLPLHEVERLLLSDFHEARLLALLVLGLAYPHADEQHRHAIFELYVRRRDRIDNWDLVDSSAPHVLGAHLADRDRTILDELAASPSVWDRRIAILATHHWIRAGDFGDTLRIAALLVNDRHDLIHKAVGWMLREIANRDRAEAERFLQRHYRVMPRTMLRYAIERFPENLRKAYLHGEI